jgi:manganese/zinc/iron transport system permease protein
LTTEKKQVRKSKFFRSETKKFLRFGYEIQLFKPICLLKRQIIMGNNLTNFILLNEPNVRTAVTGLIALSVCLAQAGTIAFVQKKSLVGDMAAHSVLPGICLGFLLAGEKRPEYLLPSAFLTGWLSVFLMQKISFWTKIKEDAALAIILSGFFGFGVWLLSIIKNSGNSGQAGLEHFLLGSAASISSADMYASLAASLIFSLFFLIFFRQIKLFCFDKIFAETAGLKIELWAWGLNSMIIFAVSLGVQAVGVVLISALLIMPAASAKYLTKKFKNMIFLSVFLGAIMVYSGAMLSYLFSGFPTGPMIVLVGFFVFLISASWAKIQKFS